MVEFDGQHRQPVVPLWEVFWMLGLDQKLHVLGPLANCHWSELVTEPSGAWRLRGHNLGVPGVVVPAAVRAEPGDEASDADA